MGQFLRVLLIATSVCPSSAGKFDHLTTCEACTSAGLGWSVKKQKCGGFPNKRCDGVEQAKSPQKLTPPPPPAPEVKTDVLVLSATTLDDAIVDHDIIMVMFFAPWCGSCKALEALYVEAAARLLASGRNAKLAKIDATKETAAAADYGVKAYPTLILFRDGNMLSTYDGERSADAFVTYMVAEAEAEAPAADDPEILRFNIANAQALMTHHLKVQVALFIDEKNAKNAEKHIDAMEDAIRSGGFSNKVLGLYIPVDDAKNTPVLDRFFVSAGSAPCIRMAVMYPDGNGIRVYGPPLKDSENSLDDGNPKSADQVADFIQAHFALKTNPLLRSEPSPRMSHSIISDLIGTTVDDFIMEKGKDVVLMLYWSTCPHCQQLQPVYEAVAARADAIADDMPAHSREITFGRIEGTRNDIGHRRIYAGSYPLIYLIPANDKDHPIQLADTRDEEGIWTFLQENTWIGDAEYLGKDEL